MFNDRKTIFICVWICLNTLGECILQDPPIKHQEDTISIVQSWSSGVYEGNLASDGITPQGFGEMTWPNGTN
uniref:Uncharacterized protein n=1 Tax=Lepeophtheirus salmonis TaxID=72036 RepID=A0A0K2UBU3_LEPSM